MLVLGISRRPQREDNLFGYSNLVGGRGVKTKK